MLGVKDNVLYFAGHSILSLVNEYTTPFFIFSKEQIKKNYRGLFEGLNANYANVGIEYKANSNYELGVLKVFNKIEAGILAVTGHEVFVSQKAEIPVDRIVFGGAWKNDEELTFAIQQGVRQVHVYSKEDLANVSRIAEIENRNLKYILQVKPQTGRFLGNRVAKENRRFGVDQKFVSEFITESKKMRNVEYSGLAVQLSDQKNPWAFMHEVDSLLGIAVKLSDAGFTTDTIRLEGGFPVQAQITPELLPFVVNPKGMNVAPVTLEYFGFQISKRFLSKSDKLTLKPRLIVQAGASLINNAGLLVTRANAVQDEWVFMDASRKLITQSSIGRNLVMLSCVKPKTESKKLNFRFAGSTSNVDDVLVRDGKLDGVNLGGTFVLIDTGAHTYSSMNQFDTLGVAGYLVNSQGEIEKLRGFVDYEDVWRLMKPE